MSRRFFDTNVILPAYDRNHPNHAKSLVLLGGLATDRPHLSVTVLGELYAGLTRAPRPGEAPLAKAAVALQQVERIRSLFVVHDVTVADWAAVVAAKKTYRDWGVWDCLIWASAKAARCNELLTEDRPGGLDELGGVRFVDPFE